MKSIRAFKFWSNAFFLIPLALSLSKIYWYAFVIGLVFFISSYFHYYNEKKLEYVDVTASLSLMVSNLTLLFIGHWKLPYSFGAIIFGVIALYFYYRQFKYGYEFNHGVWHVCSAIVSTLCVLTYIFSIS
jgi:hypothetical protein